MGLLNYLDARSDKEREEAKNITSVTTSSCQTFGGQGIEDDYYDDDEPWESEYVELQTDKLKALCRLVEILITDKYTMPGSNIINNVEIRNLLKEIQNDR